MLNLNRMTFGAVEVIAGKNCQCTLSRHTGRRILYDEVELILSGSISLTTCTCRFKHHPDRRSGIERRNFDDVNQALLQHRRVQPYGRRKVDVHNRARDSRAQLDAIPRHSTELSGEPSPV